jgi:hypothetical protein
MKKYVGLFLTIVLVNVACWATNAVSGSVPRAESIARADSAYRSLPLTLAAYNAAVREICDDMQATGVGEFKSSLKNLGISDPFIPIITPIVIPPNSQGPGPVIANPFMSTITGPAIADAILIAPTPLPVVGEAKFPLKTYVPGTVILKGSEESFILAACAESALNRPNAAIRRGFCNFIGSVAPRFISGKV